jgi:hypothetical protein
VGFDGLSAGEAAPVHISYVCMNFVTPTIAVWNEPRKPVCQLPITCPKFRSFFAEKAGVPGSPEAPSPQFRVRNWTGTPPT